MAERDITDPEAPRWKKVSRFEYLDRPFDAVWRALVKDPEVVLGVPEDGGPRLHVTLTGHDVSRAVRVTHGGVQVDGDTAHLAFRAQDASHPERFPELAAVLTLIPIAAGGRPATQVGLDARYRPPFGPLGKAGDRVAGGEWAAESITRLLGGITARLGALTGPAPDRTDRAPTGPGAPGARRVLVPVDDLASRSAAGLAGELATTPGVSRADVNPWSGMVTIEYDPQICALETILAELRVDPPAT